MQIQNLCHKKLLKISKYIPRTNQNNKQTNKKRKAKQKQTKKPKKCEGSVAVKYTYK